VHAISHVVDATARGVAPLGSREGQNAGMAFDLERTRQAFPALRDDVAYFDGPGGSQVPAVVGAAIAEAMCSGVSNRGTVTVAERRADAIVLGARQAAGDLLGADPGGVVFGRSMTQLTYDVARTLAKGWSSADEVVVTRLDHDGNVRPWVTAAERAGATLRWVEFDRESGELDVADVEAQLSERTRLVAVTGASNLLGTRPDLPAITAAVHAAGALAYIDGVHLTPHAPVDMAALGADFFVCSPYKFFGPHHGILAAPPALLETLDSDKLLPQTSEVPERFELGTLPYEVLAGTTATVDFIAGLASSAPERRTRVLESMAALEAYEDRLFERLVTGLSANPRVRLHGSPKRHTPTALFSVEGVESDAIYFGLAERGVNAPGGNFYALEASRWIGLGDDGATRAGLAPYTSESDVDRLVAGVEELSR
jgi:cysteine desulfurase family protein (TIGR01976 family)